MMSASPERSQANSQYLSQKKIVRYDQPSLHLFKAQSCIALHPDATSVTFSQIFQERVSRHPVQACADQPRAIGVTRSHINSRNLVSNYLGFSSLETSKNSSNTFIWKSGSGAWQRTNDLKCALSYYVEEAEASFIERPLFTPAADPQRSQPHKSWRSRLIRGYTPSRQSLRGQCSREWGNEWWVS